MKLAQRILLLAFVALLAACNTVAYHHAERISLAVEVKQTDPAQPVHGNFGLKTRTVLASPEAEGDAASVISDFKLTRTPEGWAGRTKINSAFLTGEAAAKAPPGTAAVMGGLASSAVGSAAANAQKQVMTKIYETLTALQAADPAAKQHAADLDQLAGLIPSPLPGTHYIESGGKLSKRTPTLVLSGFQKALEYLNELDTSIASIEKAEDDRDVKDHAGKTIDQAALAQIAKDKAALEKERRKFASAIAGSSAFDSAATYVISRI